MQLKQNSGVPIYQQIAESFKTDILAGKYKQGEFLPSIRGLAKDLKISVITTMKAYELLEQQGLVTAVQGKGYYVNAQDSESGAGQRILCECPGQRHDKGTAFKKGGGRTDGCDCRSEDCRIVR